MKSPGRSVMLYAWTQCFVASVAKYRCNPHKVTRVCADDKYIKKKVQTG